MSTEKELPVAQNRVFAWCTYRDWSFHVLEGLLNSTSWKCGLIITTENCLYPMQGFAALDIPVIRLKQPKDDLKPGTDAYKALARIKPAAIFHLGWSWFIPSEVLDMAVNLTLHPGKLPKGRGGSPIQNQIRNGDEWTWANLMELTGELDAGPVFEKERIELHGDTTDAVWARMISAGQLTINRFLGKYEQGQAVGIEQDRNIVPEITNRVTPESSYVETGELTARQIVDIVRAHQEKDPNTYVRPAWAEFNGHRLILERASLHNPGCSFLTDTQFEELLLGKAGELYPVLLDINNGKSCLRLQGRDGESVFVTQARLALREDMD